MTEPSSLSHLDDPDPPALDDGGWERIRNRSRAIARRRRATLTTAGTAAIVAVILVAAGLALTGRNRGDGVVTVGGSSSTARASTTSTTLDPSVWVTVKLEVDHTVVNQGQDVTGTVVFDNHRAANVQLTNPGDADWQVVVGPGSAKPVVTWAAPAIGGAVVIVRPGISRVAFRAATRQQSASCAQDDSLLPCGVLLPGGPARVWFVTDGTAEHVAIPSPVPITIAGRGGRPPQPKPCPVPSPEPSMATGQYCGPVPPPGNGLGPNGECTGRETTVPCAAGVVAGKYYAFTLPGRCDGVIVFDGRHWISELPPPTSVPDMNVWMRLDPNGGLGFISPNGAVGFNPDDGKAPQACTR